MAKLKSKIGNNTFSWTSDDVRDAEISAIVNRSCKNLLPPVVASETKYGVTLVNNGDGSFTISGKATQHFFMYYRLPKSIPVGHYLFTKENALGILSVFLVLEDGRWVVADDINETSPIMTLGLSIEADFDHQTPITIYPMIRDANIADNTWVPYTMSNVELTQRIQKTSYTINSTSISPLGYSNSLCINVIPPSSEYYLLSYYFDSRGAYGTYIIWNYEPENRRFVASNSHPNEAAEALGYMTVYWIKL